MATPETLDVLTRDACLALLHHHHLGRLGVTDEHGPVVVPVTYVLDGEDVLFRSGRGTKLDAARTRSPMALEIDHFDAVRRTGWSVLVRGDASIASDTEAARLDDLGLDALVTAPDAPVVRLSPWSISGRRINLPPTLPRDWLHTRDLGNVWRGRDGDDLLG